eukprot:CAMPEP_0202707544 /NCGR_PEP_ID=MMETSP1385-20130828/19864_1 /ASSEMBLY_ACC=CAM_ASM_000861 /TAXON_ID=933848 /ORGANISM="Elphidium margaritaceum" /LENGTH=95 /DNA_ID=CAMNT_0049366285 /DNA_START=1 /DNA_END=285 /DNA_ORIENTATION=+
MKEKIAWICTYSVLHCMVAYLLEIPMMIVVIFVCIEIAVLWLCSSLHLRDDRYDHVVLLFAELSVYIWVGFGHQFSIAAVMAILCDCVLASSDMP